MSAGDRWRMPGGHEALELPGSTDDELRLAVIVATWPWPAPPRLVVRALCEPMPSRYLHGAVPGVSHPIHAAPQALENTHA